MQKFVILIYTLSLSTVPYCQIGFIRSQILATDTEVTKYLDSLSSLKPNRIYFIRDSESDDGSKFLNMSFDTSDEAFFSCSSLQFGFTEVDGVNFCTSQLVMGTVKYSQANLAYIRKNFKYVSQRMWTKMYKKDIPIVIEVTFDREAGNDGVYMIMYQARQSK